MAYFLVDFPDKNKLFLRRMGIYLCLSYMLLYIYAGDMQISPNPEPGRLIRAIDGKEN